MEQKKICFIANEKKIKHIIVSRREHPQNTINIKYLSVEKVHNFKYLGVDINY